ncbi:MAG: hypothetical protein KTR20_01925 [Cellvibrionaceae bacterium]|nr:hypothetical protein [Cellvibrionaceae bacterium]
MNTHSTNPVSPGRLPGLLIPTIIILPMVVAYIMFYSGWGISGVTTNKGILLLPPQAVSTLVLSNEDTALATLYESGEKKWRMLVPVTDNCSEICEQNLYLSRQVHIRLAEKAYRVERILLLLDSLSDAEITHLQQQHPETRFLQSSPQALAAWLAPTSLSTANTDEYYYLIDQQGFAMMSYGAEHSGQDLLDDLKKLLKYTYDN